MLQIRDIEVLSSVARYYTLSRAQINQIHFPTGSRWPHHTPSAPRASRKRGS